MTGSLDKLLSLPPFGVDACAKTASLIPAVQEELIHHVEHCPPFARWCAHRGYDPHLPIEDLAAIPFLPVNIFKRMLLSSIPESDIVRMLASSATTSQTPSRIPLDQTTRNRQMRVLSAILAYRFGAARRPFLILDAPPETGNADRELSARVAGMRGYLMMATEKEYILRREGDRLVLDEDKLIAAVKRWSKEDKPFCMLGYTYVLYEYVVKPLRDLGRRVELPESTFILHFGGWKQLRRQAVDKQALNAETAEVFRIERRSICDIYGFTEQLGVVYPDDAEGLKRAPTYSEVFVRDPRTLQPVPDGEVGLLEFVCPLPHSYPGIAILLDDLGRIVTRQPGADGMTGAAFEIVGRAERAEARGCGDTLPHSVYGGSRSSP